MKTMRWICHAKKIDNGHYLRKVWNLKISSPKHACYDPIHCTIKGFSPNLAWNFGEFNNINVLIFPWLTEYWDLMFLGKMEANKFCKVR